MLLHKTESSQLVSNVRMLFTPKWDSKYINFLKQHYFMFPPTMVYDMPF